MLKETTPVQPPPDAWVSVHSVHGTPAFMISQRWIDLMMQEITLLIRDTLTRCLPGIDISLEAIKEHIRSFRKTYQERPVRENHGGAGFSNLFWLFLFAKVIKPKLVIESGVWRGQSSWFLRAACPDAEFHAFDISLKHLIAKVSDIKYHEYDWEVEAWDNVDRDRSLIHFDDHVNQAKRVREAHGRGFRHLLFDDNLPAYQIFKDTPAIIPTIDMLHDPNVHEGDEFSWYDGKRVVTTTLKDQTLESTRLLIAYWENLPAVDPESRSSKSRIGALGKFAYIRLVN